MTLAYALNPMVGVVEGFRWALLGCAQPPTLLFAGSALTSALVLGSGLVIFRRLERRFADRV
jgi:lipopolysaccharide transport system permease protein